LIILVTLGKPKATRAEVWKWG